MMFKIIQPLTDYFHKKGVHTSSFVFRLITCYTLNLFVLFVLFLGASNLFGEPVNCYSVSKDSTFSKAMTLNCWLEGLYIDKNLLNGIKGTDVVNYGVGTKNTKDYENPELVYFKFYQWIVPLMMLHTLVLYVPRFTWRMLEKKTMMHLLDNVYCPVFNEDWDKRKKQLVAYMKDVRKKYHRQYALNYLFCECLTIVSILFNMYITKCVVTDFWSEYQPAVTAFFIGNFTKFNREAARLFPIQAKCTFYHFGPSGTIQDRDALCILPQNVVNEKIFVVIYVWYICLLFFAIFNVLFLLAMYVFKILRIFNIGHMLERTVTIRECKEISSNGDLGLWFTLTIFRKNMSSIHFQDLCKDLQDKLKHEKAPSHLEYEDVDKYS